MNISKKIVLPGLSLAIIGLGLSISIEAGIWKYSGKPFIEWVSFGTLGLIFFNGGLSLFGRAIIDAIKK